MKRHKKCKSKVRKPLRSASRRARPRPGDLPGDTLRQGVTLIHRFEGPYRALSSAGLQDQLQDADLLLREHGTVQVLSFPHLGLCVVTSEAMARLIHLHSNQRKP